MGTACRLLSGERPLPTTLCSLLSARALCTALHTMFYVLSPKVCCDPNLNAIMLSG
jgi:hypothetical protein